MLLHMAGGPSVRHSCPFSEVGAHAGGRGLLREGRDRDSAGRLSSM